MLSIPALVTKKIHARSRLFPGIAARAQSARAARLSADRGRTFFAIARGRRSRRDRQGSRRDRIDVYRRMMWRVIARWGREADGFIDWTERQRGPC
jgi:hypothetical protein